MLFRFAKGEARTDVETALIAVEQDRRAVRFMSHTVIISSEFQQGFSFWEPSSSSDDDSDKQTHVSRVKKSRSQITNTQLG